MEEIKNNSPEDLLRKDAKNIPIDENFKKNLKAEILKKGRKEEKHKTSYFKYAKVASLFLVIGITGATLTLKASNNYVKNEDENIVATEKSKELNKTNSNTVYVKGVSNKDEAIGKVVKNPVETKESTKPKETTKLNATESTSSKTENTNKGLGDETSSGNGTSGEVKKPIDKSIPSSNTVKPNNTKPNNVKPNTSKPNVEKPVIKDPNTGKNIEDTTINGKEEIPGDGDILSDGSIVFQVASISLVKNDNAFLETIIAELDKEEATTEAGGETLNANGIKEAPLKNSNKGVEVKLFGSYKLAYSLRDLQTNEKFNVISKIYNKEQKAQHEVWYNNLFGEESKYNCKRLVYSKENKVLYLIAFNKEEKKHEVIQFSSVN